MLWVVLCDGCCWAAAALPCGLQRGKQSPEAFLTCMEGSFCGIHACGCGGFCDQDTGLGAAHRESSWPGWLTARSITHQCACRFPPEAERRSALLQPERRLALLRPECRLALCACCCSKTRACLVAVHEHRTRLASSRTGHNMLLA